MACDFKIWLPKSQVSIVQKIKSDITIAIPEWIALENNLARKHNDKVILFNEDWVSNSVSKIFQKMDLELSSKKVREFISKLYASGLQITAVEDYETSLRRKAKKLQSKSKPIVSNSKALTVTKSKPETASGNFYSLNSRGENMLVKSKTYDREELRTIKKELTELPF
jgi:hypothetical protein